MSKEEEKPEGEEAAEGGGKKKLIIIIGGVVVLLIVVGVVLFFVLKGHPEEEAAAEGGEGGDPHAAKDAHAKDAKKDKKADSHGGHEGIGPVFILKETMVVNLSSEGGSRFCKIGVGLELDNHKMEPEMMKREALIKDVIISVVSRKTPEELMTPKGQDAVKQEIMDLINDTLKDGRVTKVYFTTFLIQ